MTKPTKKRPQDLTSEDYRVTDSATDPSTLFETQFPWESETPPLDQEQPAPFLGDVFDLEPRLIAEDNDDSEIDSPVTEGGKQLAIDTLRDMWGIKS